MTLETQVLESSLAPHKRKFRQSKGNKAKKKTKVFPGTGGKAKIDKRMKQLFRKRARNYNSDDDQEEPALGGANANARPFGNEEVSHGNSSGEEEENGPDSEDNVASDDEGDAVQPGITKFAEGCRGFKIAFKKITKINVSDNPLGPVLSAHQKLVVKKLAEEVSERKIKGDAKKEKHMVAEKGHVKELVKFLDSHEKFLISVATKGVVKLFNAVNKAQNAQKGLNPSRFKDAKELEKRRKRAFLAELRKKPSQAGDNLAKEDDGPGWAPLRDSYMSSTSKLKDWDKMQDTSVGDDMDESLTDDSSSDED